MRKQSYRVASLRRPVTIKNVQKVSLTEDRDEDPDYEVIEFSSNAASPINQKFSNGDKLSNIKSNSRRNSLSKLQINFFFFFFN